MADPIDPSSIDPAAIAAAGDAADKSASQMHNFSDTIQGARNALNGFNTTIDVSSQSFSALDGWVKNVGVSFNNTKALTSQQATQFSLLSNAVLGARDSYKSLVGTDFTGFKGQITEITRIAAESPMTPLGEKAVSVLRSIAQAGGKTLNDIANMSVTSLGRFAESIITSTDNALKLQTGFLQLAGKTGDLGNVFQVAGPKLNNINVLLEQQSKMISDTIKATGAAPDVVEKYYTALGSVPKALNSMITSSSGANQQTTMLTAAMKVASGTGRDFSDVVDDLKIGWRDYGLTGEGALKFSSQISAVTQDLGVELDVVRDALRGNADAFKVLTNNGAAAGDMVSGLSDIMNTYASALENTGLSGTQSVDIISKMTKQVGQLSIAQKAFLSSQTGGPGGLMGAFQIDKMIREGDIKGVFEKVRQQMQKQLGPLVNLQEASQSQAAAAQMTRQIMMLRQGPLGSMAGSDADAQRLIEGFRNMQEGRGGKDVGTNILKETIDRGNSVQEKSYSVMSDMRGHLEAIRRSTDINTLSLIQKSGLTAGRGTTLQPGEMEQNAAAERLQQMLQKNMLSSTNMNTQEMTGSAADIMSRKRLIDNSGRDMVNAITGLQDSLSNLPLSVKGPIQALKDAISTGNMGEIQSQTKLLEDAIKKRKEDARKANVDTKINMADEINIEDNVLTQARQVASTISAPPSQNIANTENPARDNTIPQKQEFSFTHHITGFCLKCKQEIDNSSQSNAISPQSKSF